MPGFRRDRLFQVQDRTRSMVAPPLPHTLALCSKIILTHLFHAFAPHLLDMGHQPPRPRILTGPSVPRPPFSRRRSPPFMRNTLQHCQRRTHLQERLYGRQAVDKIAYITKTTDRNLALLLGRALDAQKYFHAVTYDHRLRDSLSDVYQFRSEPIHAGYVIIGGSGFVGRCVSHPLYRVK